MTNNEVLIKVENVSKKFCRRLKRSLWYGMKDLGSELIGRSNSHKELRKDEFWAIDDISFELRRGECLGLIGPNGSGKSTLLKMLNGLIKPDKGKITIHGRVGALIELGAGFNPILTGRENIYINGSVLGFTAKEIKEKFESILEFAEIGEFIDTPVQNYSSGMKVRLGFAVAAHMEPDILILDEVLAVGDIGFRAKCYNAINKISGIAAVVFVSHYMPQVGRLCNSVTVLNHGHAMYQGKDVPKGIENYYSNFETPEGTVGGNGKATLHRVEFESKGKMNVEQINFLDDLTIHLDITVDPEIKHFVVGFYFNSFEEQFAAECNSLFNKKRLHNTGDLMHIAVKLTGINLKPFIYRLTVNVTDVSRTQVLAAHHYVKELKISGDFVGHASLQLVGEWELNQRTIT